MNDKMCVDCAELREKNGVRLCHEMWDKPCSSLEECPLGFTCEEVEKAQELTAEQKKAIKEVKNCDTHTLTKKAERKPRSNPEKENIIENLANYLENCDFGAENVEILNKSREISFKISQQEYKIQLIATRKPKN